MPSEREYQEEIRRYTHSDLVSLYDELSGEERTGPLSFRYSESRQWDLGKALEYLIVRAFEEEGAEVRYPFEVPNTFTERAGTMEQIDGAVYYQALACLIEAKDWSGPVDYDEIARLQANLLRRPTPTFGLFFARNGYTTPAIILTRVRMQPTVLLWEWSDLGEALIRRRMRDALLLKYRCAVDEGDPALNVRGLL